MRHTLVKLTGLLVALMLALTGCNLIGIDQMKQLDLDFAALEKDFSTVVATYDGGEITKGDALPAYVSMVSYYNQIYTMFGMSINDTVLENIKQQTLENLVRNVAIDKELKARGIELSEEKLAEVQTQADENYQSSYDAAYASAEGKGDAKARQTEYNLAANGYSREGIYNQLLAQAKSEALEEALRAEVSELTDEQLQAAYDAEVADDQDSFEDLELFEKTMTEEDGITAWFPEGYRTVKHILVKPADDVMTAVTDTHAAMKTLRDNLKELEEELEEINADPEANPERTAGDVQAEIDAARAEIETKQPEVDAADAAALENVRARTDEIYAKLAEGAEFADLIAEYGEDPGMTTEPTMTRGYYVSANSENWDDAFTAGAMALEKVGDVSAAPVIGTSGAHIIRYESDVTPGPVPLADIHDALYASTLEEAQDTHATEVIDALTAALNPTYNVEAFTLS